MDIDCSENYKILSELAKECGEDNFFSKLLESPTYAGELETQLCRLDEKALHTFKSKVTKYANKWDTLRGYQQVIDVLNELKGYIYLKENGCTCIEFIHEQSEKGKNTPDLKASCENEGCFLEMKTIHMSDDETFYLLENSREETYEILQNSPQEIEFPNSLKDKICVDKRQHGRRILTFKGVMSEEEKDVLLKLSQDKRYKEAIEALFQRSQRLRSGHKLIARDTIRDIPKGLKMKLKDCKEKAEKQLGNKPGRKICYFIIDLDLQIRLDAQNYEELDRYLNILKSENPEIEIMWWYKKYKKG